MKRVSEVQILVCICVIGLLIVSVLIYFGAIVPANQKKIQASYTSTPGPSPTPTITPIPTNTPIASERSQIIKSDVGDVTRFVDYDAQVVCYAIKVKEKDANGTYSNGKGMGIGIGIGLSCLPLDQTSLSKE
jgi:hypothetical protein